MKFNFLERKNGAISLIVFMNILLAGVALIRDVFLAVAIGTTAEADAFILAFSIPDIIGNNLIAVSVGVACVPLLTDVLIHKGEKEFSRSLLSITASVLTFCVALYFLALIFRNEIIGIVGGGLSGEILNLAILLFSIMLPVVFIYPLFTIGSSVLHIRSSFAIPAVAPVIFNTFYLLSIIAGFLMYEDKAEISIMISYAVVIGVSFMALVVWGSIFIKKHVERPQSFKGFFDKDEFKKYLKMLYPYLAVLLAYQTVLYSERYLASTLETGAISSLNYAYRIAQMPTWIFVAAVGTFSLPALSRLKSENNHDGHKEIVLAHLMLTFIVALPFTAFIYIMRVPIVQTLLSRGAFDENSVNITAGILAGYSFAILGLGVFSISIRFFLSMKYIMYPTIAVMISSSLNIVANFLLTKHIGSAGLGYGAAIGGMLNVILFVFLLNCKLDGIIKKKASEFFKIFICAIILVPELYVFKFFWKFSYIQQNDLTRLLYMTFIFVFCAVVYFAGIKLMKVKLS